MLRTGIYLIVFMVILTAAQHCSTKMECITGIKSFGAYPSEVVDDPSFYYDCSGTRFAVLKRCRDDAVYGPQMQSCRLLNNPNAVSHRRYRIRSTRTKKRNKRNVQEAMKKYLARKGVSEHAKQPVLGRPIKLGALYYGKEDRIAFDQNLWNDNTLRKNASRNTMKK